MKIRFEKIFYSVYGWIIIGVVQFLIELCCLEALLKKKVKKWKEKKDLI